MGIEKPQPMPGLVFCLNQKKLKGLLALLRDSNK